MKYKLYICSILKNEDHSYQFVINKAGILNSNRLAFLFICNNYHPKEDRESTQRDRLRMKGLICQSTAVCLSHEQRSVAAPERMSKYVRLGEHRHRHRHHHHHPKNINQPPISHHLFQVLLLFNHKLLHGHLVVDG